MGTIRKLACGLAALVLLGGCVIEKAAECGDDEANGDEGCDGSDFDGASCVDFGFDEGTLGCSNSCEVDTSGCILLDEDQDQLSIYDEQSWGTDPLNPDTDGDGVLDGVEALNGADPLDWTSWPGQIGAWPNHFPLAMEAQIQPSGYHVGEIAYDRAWTDQFGQPVNLYQFYGYVTVMSVGARWCPPCQQAAQTSPALLEKHKPQGVILVELLREGLVPEIYATQEDAALWAERFGLQYPVVVEEFPLPVPSVPTYYIMDRQLQVRYVYEGFPGDAQLSADIENIVADSDGG